MNQIFVLSAFAFYYTTTILTNINLNDKDINEIYEKFIKPNINNEYKTRYVSLPLEKNKDFWPWKGKDLPRVIAVLEFEKFIKENNITCNNGLAINGLDPEWNYLSPKQILQINYTDDPEKYDLIKMNLPQKDFDFVIVNQTFEHVCDPIRCLENIYRHMKDGGLLYFNVPASSIPHSTPFHYYTGFTPVGVGAITKLAGFKILNIGSWGNKDYLKKMYDIDAWPDYINFKNKTINDIECCPIITWIFAMK